MFFIVPEKESDLVEALRILSYYHVAASSYSDDGENLYVAVIPDHYDHEDDDDAVGLAEAAFQMNWHQGGVCPECVPGTCNCEHGDSPGDAPECAHCATYQEAEICSDCDVRYNCANVRGDCQLMAMREKPGCGHMVFTKPIKPAF